MTLVKFGSFTGGNLSEFSDSSANGSGGGNGTTVMALDWSGAPGGKYKARIVTNPVTSPVYYGDSAKVRVHLLGSSAISAMMTQGSTFYRAFSMRWYGNAPLGLFAGDEIHSSGPYALASGPVPLNGFGIDIQGGVPKKLWRIRGAVNPNDTAFNQWTFGAHPQGDNNGGSRQSQAWVGLTDTVTTGEWIHTLAVYDPFHPTAGFYELWACAHGNQMVNVVPRKQIGNCYPSPIGHYPMISVYYNRSGSTDHTIEVAAGAYATGLAEAQAFQIAEVGYDMWQGGGAPPPPPPSATPLANTRETRIGASTAGVGTNGFSGNMKSGSKFTTGLAPGASGSVKDFHVYAKGNDGTTSTQALKPYFYADSAGEPGALWGVGDQFVVAGDAAAAWVKQTLGTPVTFSGDNLWILIGSDTPTNRVLYGTDVSAGALRYNNDLYSDGAADPAGAMSSANILMSVIADYDVVVASDTTAPTISSIVVSTGTNVTMLYDETLAATTPVGEDFVVTADAVPIQVVAIDITDASVTLTLGAPALAGQTVLLSYTGFTGRKLQDAAGNFAANLTSSAVTNSTPAGLPHRTSTIARSISPRSRVVGSRPAGEGGGGL